MMKYKFVTGVETHPNYPYIYIYINRYIKYNGTPFVRPS